ncbi:MAG: hypothetical protein HYZ83_02795 [Candidatus Omnitrophica bacterium]|nr:hypothetical protein [Candidatus Omnitrophota bacterium]
MSTLTGEKHSKVLVSEADLSKYFHAFAKSRDCMRVGIEAEFFGVNEKTGLALPYDGPGGIERILKRMAERFGYSPVIEQDHIIALQRGKTFITLEPGAQVELSAEPVWNVFEIEDQLKTFFGEILEISKEFPRAAWLASGFHPFSRLDQTAWVPKRRYQIMWEYLKTHGTQSHEMMKRTATNQINFDYLSETHAMESLRVSLGITSMVTAMFANSAFSEGRPNGFICKRLDVWNHTDPDRTGLMVEFTQPDKTFQDYLRYLLDMPVIFIVRNHEWVPLGNLSFRQFIREGYQGEKATVGDFELHLSSAFPEVRLKQYLEIRGVDCQSPELIPAVAAFWKGILYDSQTREKAWKLVSYASEEERMSLHLAVPREGLRAKLGAKPILPIVRELVELSCHGLSKQKVEDHSRNECIFLERIRQQITRPGKSPAETLLEKWNGEFQQNPQRLLEALQLTPPS